MKMLFLIALAQTVDKINKFGENNINDFGLSEMLCTQEQFVENPLCPTGRCSRDRLSFLIL